MFDNPNITMDNAVLEPPREMKEVIKGIGNGRINFKDTTILKGFDGWWGAITVNDNATLNIEGGTHKGLTVCTYTGFIPDQSVNNPATISITGNVNSEELVIMPSVCQGSTPLNRRRHNMKLQGSWSAYKVKLWGNLGINMTASAYKETASYGASSVPGWFQDDTPAIVMRNVRLAFNLEELVTTGTPDDRDAVFVESLNLSQKLLKSGTTVHQFCALMDTHKDESCRCGLYYSLLLIREPLAIAYYLRHNPALAHQEPEPLQAISESMLEDALREKLFSLTPVTGAVKVRYVSAGRFESAIKKCGVGNINLFWSDHPDGGEHILEEYKGK